MGAAKETGQNRQKRLESILAALQRKYPEAPLALRFTSSFELLIAVILSAQCTDQRVNQVTEHLFSEYRVPEDYLRVPVEKLEEQIKSTGFYRNKAKSIVACCRMLVDQFGGKVPEDIDETVKLPGVGRKTAAMVLGNAYGLQQGIAVDTHVGRVAQRLQLSQAKTPEKIELDLMALAPREKWTWLSNAFILHGRETCKARAPLCKDCFVESWCPYDNKTL
mgnify:CR=1 FL=1